jgi:hypothetical protein
VNFTALVISDEVGKLAWTSHAHFFSALNSFVKEGRIGEIAELNVMYDSEFFPPPFQIQLPRPRPEFSPAVP